MRLKSTSGFTLIELLVTIAIIALIAGMLMYAVSKSWSSAKRTQAVKLASEVAKATELYMLEFGELPPVTDSAIYTYLSGKGTGRLWDATKRVTVNAPLNFGGNMFTPTPFLLKSPFTPSLTSSFTPDPLKDFTFIYTTTKPTMSPSNVPVTGVPANLKVYVYHMDPDDSSRLIGNWGVTE